VESGMEGKPPQGSGVEVPSIYFPRGGKYATKSGSGGRWSKETEKANDRKHRKGK